MLGVGGLRRVAAAAATWHRPLSTAGGQPTVALRDGTSMPAAICGTYVGNAEGHTSPEDCPALVVAALEVGFQHFDSALMYMNEAELGAALKGADNIYVTTKIAHPDDPNRNHTACTYMEDPEARDAKFAKFWFNRVSSLTQWEEPDWAAEWEVRRKRSKPKQEFGDWVEMMDPVIDAVFFVNDRFNKIQWKSPYA